MYEVKILVLIPLHLLALLLVPRQFVITLRCYFDYTKAMYHT